MKETIFICVVVLAFFVWVGNLSITLKPFSISMPEWHRALGFLLIAIGITIIEAGTRFKAYSEGLKKGSEITIETLKEYAEDNV